MTTIATRPTLPGRGVRPGTRSRSLPSWTVPAAAVVAVLARLPLLGHAPGPDESGFLLVGAQWNGAGTSLYGNYWVDRPPLLVTIFRAASLLEGVPALRIIGCFAVLLVVLGCACAATLMHGEQVGRWAAVTAAALCVSPLLGGYAVNGELLAAPFVVGGIIAVISALRADDEGQSVRWSVLAGACAVSALMVKQNFADVAVFGSVAFVLSAVRSDITWRRLVALTAAASVGAAVALGVLSVWTVAHGTSLRGVFDAMYPFRVEAGQVIAAGGRVHSTARLHGLLAVAFSAMVIPLMCLVLVDVVRRRRRSPVWWALLATLTFATASVLIGGNFWHHYLVGLVVPVSLAVGVTAADRAPVIRALVGLAVASAVLAWVGSLALPQGSEGETVGTGIASVAQPKDTIVNLYGHADVVQTSGLSSPYEHLWSLPVKTLDPSLTELDAVLAGPDAPTWLVTGRSIRSWGLDTDATAALVARDYRKVSTVCDRTIYLRNGTDRAAPQPITTCRGASLASSTKESQP
ncbi:hypothetical protein [Aeromicrobium stalagmiti]|uniref:hypothetical protein n=1 Tax=Aeromicrobium stalagmiti TaxID=2738988 RepID=UPI00156A29A6|nr:hypothetical protein [Aeromicrobium stalagmiti]NRQ51085.1 hypothetical protein [Aeromicrobium stalagmiti]